MVSAIVSNSSSENVGKFVTVQFNLLDSKGDLVTSQEQVEMFTSADQTLALGNRPVLAEPPLELEVLETSVFERWEQVDDFAESDPEARHYRLDRARGEITFGDGRRGRIPPAGQGNVVARRYRFGGRAMARV